MSKIVEPRPTIAELETLLDKHGNDAVNLAPDGSVHILDEKETLEKQLTVERGNVAALRLVCDELRRRLEQIVEIARKP